MAEIDKALPNVKQTVNIPGPQEVEAAEQEALAKQQEAGEPIEQVQNEDGSPLILILILQRLIQDKVKAILTI
jgi:hypothetical protein